MTGRRKSIGLMVAKAIITTAFATLAVNLAAGQEKPTRDVRPLTSGETIEREFGGDEQHFYALTLKQGEAVQIDLTEKGVDCLVAIFYAGGARPRSVLDVDFGSGFDRETATYIARDAGPYVVGIGGHPASGRGKYSLTARVAPASPPQQLRSRAVQTLDEALELWASPGGGKSLRAVAQKLQDSFNLWKELKEDYWVAHTAVRLGKLFINLSQKDEAVQYLELALDLFRKSGDKAGQSHAASNLGTVYAEFNQFTEALTFFSESLAIREEIGYRAGTATLLVSVGAVYASRGSPQKASENYERALQILKDVPNRETEARALAGLALLYAQRGEPAKALGSLNQVLALADETAEPNSKPRLLNEVASVYRQLGELKSALEYHSKSLALYQENGNLQGQAIVSSNIGSVYFSLGESRQAQNYFQQALDIHKQIGDAVGAAIASHNLSKLYKEVGDTERMTKSLLDSIELLKGKESENPALHADLLLEAGELLGGSDDEAAIAAYQRAIKISHAIGYKTNEAMALINLASLYSYRGDLKLGLKTYNQAQLAAAASSEPEIETWALAGAMAAWWKAGNPDFAVFYGKQALNKHQTTRTRIRGLERETQQSYTRKNTDTYNYLANILLGRGRHGEALQVINASQDQQHYDFTGDSAAPAKPIDLTAREAAFAATYVAATERVAGLARQLETLKLHPADDPATSRTQRIEGQLDAAIEEFSAAVERAAANFARPLRAGEDGNRAADLAELQSILRELSAVTGQKTVALYPLASVEEFRVLLVTPHSAFTAALPVRDDVVNEKVLQFYALLQTPSLDTRPLGRELYGLIVKPVEAQLRAAGAQTLLWSLGGTLRYVPMASLWDGQRYLVERFQNVVFTRADRERMTRAVSPVWTGVGFGTSRAHAVDLFGNGDRVPLPALPGVSEEMPAIFRPAGRDGVVKGEVFLDDEFTRIAFLGLAKQRPALVHVASHFSFRPGDDRQSFLLLGDGTTLTLDEIKQQGRLFEGVELLTLSACETAATRPDAMGREIDGFAESAQRLGAAAVMATLWTVADNSTSRLMREFYRARQGVPPLTKAEALRRAQLRLLHGTPGGAPTRAARASAPASFKVELVDAPGGGKGAASGQTGRVRGAGIIYVDKSQAPAFKTEPDRPFAHPFYWAPFVLIGNGR